MIRTEGTMRTIREIDAELENLNYAISALERARDVLVRRAESQCDREHEKTSCCGEKSARYCRHCGFVVSRCEEHGGPRGATSAMSAHYANAHGTHEDGNLDGNRRPNKNPTAPPKRKRKERDHAADDAAVIAFLAAHPPMVKKAIANHISRPLPMDAMDATLARLVASGHVEHRARLINVPRPGGGTCSHKRREYIVLDRRDQVASDDESALAAINSLVDTYGDITVQDAIENAEMSLDASTIDRLIAAGRLLMKDGTNELALPRDTITTTDGDHHE
jgi:hypothetical protein